MCQIMRSAGILSFLYFAQGSLLATALAAASFNLDIKLHVRTHRGCIQAKVKKTI